MSSFLSSLRQGATVNMVNVGGRNPDIVSLLKRCGADAAFIDCERTGIGLDAASDVIVAARACGLPAVVRSHSRAGPELVRFLDRGADALVVPHIGSAKQVREAVEVMRYACGDEVAGRALIIQIETRGALQELEAIAEVQGVDAFLLGPNDIAYELAGARGQHTPVSMAALERACDTLRELKRPFGYPARPAELAKFSRRGASLLYVSVEWLLDTGLRAYSGPTAT